MIKPSEIQNNARAVVVRDQQIEKDYILSWILQGVAENENLSKALVFKGGTVLKKAYFKDYRFSEYLDFTLLNDEIMQRVENWEYPYVAIREVILNAIALTEPKIYSLRTKTLKY
jgi:predicted nucleotidyltransferase component of viral defense system